MARKLPSLKDLGEDEIVRRLIQTLPSSKRTLVGPGDDCAVLETSNPKLRELFKTDCILESIHFRADEKPSRIGWKALCRCISDIAAMGGWPSEALVTIAAPSDMPWQKLKGIYAGLNKAATAHGIGIVGGETSSVPSGAPLFISISMIGFVETDRLVLRSGGKEGDLVFVSGRLGGSIAGWHLDFTPRLEQARWLSQNSKPSAMMDLSDGIAKDLPRLAEASGTGFELFPEALPRRRGCSMEQAMNDGEDYELLFTISPDKAGPLQKKWSMKFPSLPLTQVGKLGDEDYGELVGGWDHFG
jgi:thiamine-monophosphate kinase